MPPLARPAAPSAPAQDFAFLRAAPAKTPVPPADLFAPLESEVVRKQAASPPPDPSPSKPAAMSASMSVSMSTSTQGPRAARTVRLAPSPRPRLDATVVAKKRGPKR